jgi:3-phosphoglycerate kinase
MITYNTAAAAVLKEVGLGLLRRHAGTGLGRYEAAAEVSGFASQMTHISTGGGASLEYLQGEKLPGLEVLRKRKQSESSTSTPTM